MYGKLENWKLQVEDAEYSVKWHDPWILCSQMQVLHAVYRLHKDQNAAESRIERLDRKQNPGNHNAKDSKQCVSTESLLLDTI